MPTYKKDIFDELEILGKRIEKESKLLAERIANVYFTRLKENIISNKYGFSLSDKTMAVRLFRGIQSTTPLIETGEYLMAIVVNGSVVTVKQGVHRGTRNNNHNLTYEELSYILEYGRFDKGIPPFPVWRNTFDEVQPIIKAMVDEFANKNLSKRKR